MARRIKTTTLYDTHETDRQEIAEQKFNQGSPDFFCYPDYYPHK